MNAVRPAILTIFVFLSLTFVNARAIAEKVCDTDKTQQCACPDNSTGTQACLAEGNGWKQCDCFRYGAWYDEATNLSWQDPQKDAYSSRNGGVISFDGIRYCEELDILGYDDWRLPNIDELRTLISGVPKTGAGGTCRLSLGSGLRDTTIAERVACGGKPESFTCSGAGGCCWNEGLTGTCNTIDPASSTHYLEYWSSTPAKDDPNNWIGYVMFDTGSVGFNHSLSLGEVRCVRDGPTPLLVAETGDSGVKSCVSGSTRACSCSNGKTGAQPCNPGGYGPCQCTGFVPSPAAVDVCAGGDTVKVTVNVPERLSKQPYMLTAFLYEYGQLDMRPPDVGIDENEIRYPDIDVDKPLTTTIPGCSYYRDRRMTGDYYLTVLLKMEEGKFPGPPGPLDMVWDGAGDEPITLTGDGTTHYDIDVMLEPIFKR
jgi:hypothetical protein